MSYHPVGAISDTGLSPYKVSGDPIIALIAQLNRFAGKTVSPGSGCGARKYVPTPLPLVPVLDDKAAYTAVVIVQDRYLCVPPEVMSKTKAKWAIDGLSNPIGFVTQNLSEIITTLAQVGDSHGLDPAAVGITAVDPKMKSPFSMTTALIVGALAIGAVFVSRSKR